MLGLIKLIFCLVFDLFRSRATLEAEILVLRQQIILLRRGRVGRLPFSASDRLVLGWVCGLFPNTCDALAIIRPETVMRWHRAGFRSYWRWKSKRRPGRPASGRVPIALSRRKTAVHASGISPRAEDSTLRLGATRRRSRRRGGRLVVARCAMRICCSSNKPGIPVRHARGD